MLVELLETNYSDISSKGFNEFVRDFSNSTEDLFVVFSNSINVRYEKNGLQPYPNAMVAYSVAYVINNQDIFINMKSSYINVIRLVGDGINIQIADNNTVLSLMNRVGFSEQASEDLIHYINIQYRNNPDKHLTKYLIKKYNKTLKVPFVIDTATTRYGAILNQDYPNIAFITKPYAFKQVTYYLNRNIDPTIASKKDTRKLAAFISDAMGKSLSSDEPISLFADVIFWTNDGLEIKITKLGSDIKGLSHSGVYFIIEIDTPNGIILFNTKPEDSFYTIKENVRMRYNVLNTPNDNWEPKSRDMYLTSIRKEYKMYDIEKSRYTKTVDEYFPVLRTIGIRYGIDIPHVSKYSDIDKIVIYLFMEKFLRKQKDPLLTFNELTESGGIDISEVVGKVKSGKVTEEVLYNITRVYAKLKAMYPSKNGWHILEKYKDE